MRLNKLSLAVASTTLLFAAGVSANQSLNKPGYSATIGGVSNISTVHSSSHNPAANNLLIGEGEKLRFGYLSNLGAYVELGESKDLDKKIDKIVDFIDDAGSAGEYINYVNSVVDDINQGGQFRAGASVSAPFVPMLIKSDLARGTFSINANYSVQVRGQMHMDKLPPTNNVEDWNGKNFDSALDMHSAKILHASIGYGTNLSDLLELDNTHGQLEAGARLNIYGVEMGRSFNSVLKEIKSNGNDKFSDNLTDNLFDNTKKTTKADLDIGALWHADSYQAGVTVYNLAQNKFKGPDISQRLTNQYDIGALDSLSGKGKVRVQNEVKLTTHAVLEGAWFPMGRQLSISGYATAGKATNFVGDKSQFIGAAVGYFPDSWIIPAVRAGYNKNLAGTKLSTINAGTTMFGVFNLDLAMSTKKSSIDGTSLPRYLAVSIGFEEKF